MGGRDVRLQQRYEVGAERCRDFVADTLPGDERRARDRLGQSLAVVEPVGNDVMDSHTWI